MRGETSKHDAMYFDRKKPSHCNACVIKCISLSNERKGKNTWSTFYCLCNNDIRFKVVLFLFSNLIQGKYQFQFYPMCHNYPSPIFINLGFIPSHFEICVELLFFTSIGPCSCRKKYSSI